MRVLIIIPAYNEEKNLKRVIGNLQQVCPQFDYVIVNDGSTDGTERLCRQNQYRHISLPVNLGLSAAVRAGMRYASQKGYDMALQFDADGQHLPEYIQPMVDCMTKTNCDVVIASRYFGCRMPLRMRTVGAKMITAAIRLTTGRHLSDPTSGMRMFNRRLLEEFAQNLNYGPEPDTISYLIKNGASVKEVQVEMGERMAGQSYLTFWRSVQYMVKMSVSILLIQWFRKRDTETPYPERSL